VDVELVFSTNVTSEFMNSIVSIFTQNLMANNNSIEIDGVSYPAAIDMIFERGLPSMNGSLISLNNDNVTACMSLFAYNVISAKKVIRSTRRLFIYLLVFFEGLRKML